MVGRNVGNQSKVHAILPAGYGRQTAIALLLGHAFLGRAIPRRPRVPHLQVMDYNDKIVDKQVGRNSDLFAQAIGKLETRAERYPHLRILVSIIEQAHPEWNHAPNKDRQVSSLVMRMSKGLLDPEEVAEIVQLRDAERGWAPIPEGDDDDDDDGDEEEE